MKNSTKIVGAVILLLTGVLQIGPVQDIVVAFIASHPAIAAAVAGLSSILALLHKPAQS